MRVLVVPDKFKGTLTALQAAEAIAQGWTLMRPDDQLELLPMSDGGDGFGEIIGRLLQAEPRSIRVLNAAHETVVAEWWWSESRETAVLESAKVIGLAMLPPGKFHPFQLDTFGLGQALHHIAFEHPGSRILIGIGGSATNDAGFGMARALGFKFDDATGYCIERWLEMVRLLRIRPPADFLPFSQVTIATDVQNPLLGPHGASRVYGPQKGLREEDFPAADRCFERLVATVKADLQLDLAEEPGTGAAGGLGYGLRVFLNGQFKPGFDIFKHVSQLEEKISRADLVITGEGSIDRQTLMGKGTGAIAKLARAHNKPCIGLAGFSTESDGTQLFDLLLSITPNLATPEDSKRDAARWLGILSRNAAAAYNAQSPVG